MKFGTILSYVSIFLSIVAGLLYTPWMIRVIGQSDFGLYTLANSQISFFVIDFGLGIATSRYVAKYRAENNLLGMSRFLGLVLKLYLLLDACLFLILFLIYFNLSSIYSSLTTIEIERFKVVYCIAAFFSIVNFPNIAINGILNAYEKFIQLKLADVLFRLLDVGLTIIALLMGYGLFAVVAVHAFAGIIVFVYKIWAVYQFTTANFDVTFFDRDLFKEIFSFSFWTTISSFAQRLIFNVTPSILGIVANSVHVAIFGVVTSIEVFSFMIVNAINGMFMPRISRMYAQNKSDELLALLVKVGRFQYSLNGLIVVGFAFVGKKFINMWVGAEYADAYICLLLVLIPGVFYSALQIANTSLIVTKNVNLQAYVMIIIGCLNFVFSCFLSQKWGVIGACSSICFAYVVRAILLNIIYYRKLKINIPYFLTHCYLKMSIPIIGSILVLYPIHLCLAQGNGWLYFGLEGLVICVVYLLMTFLFGLEKNERKNLIRR